MKTLLFRSVVISALLSILAGCVSTRTFDYYRLQAHAPVESHKVDGAVGVAPVTLPGWFESGAVSWSDGYRVHRSENNRWGAEIKKQIEHVLSVNLGRQLAGEPVTVGPWLGGNRPDLAVHVQIEDVSLMDNTVEMNITWSVLNKAKEIVYRRGEGIVAVKENAGASKEEQLVKGMSSLLATLGEQIAVRLAQNE